MANITQTIPNLTQGISQQPDEYKVPGQVADMINCLPDVTEGLQKRPAGKFVASLSDNANASLNSTTNGRWFHYYRDEQEQYIGQIAQNGVVRMWNCLTGAPQTIVNAIGNNTYLTYSGLSGVGLSFGSGIPENSIVSYIGTKDKLIFFSSMIISEATSVSK